MIAKPTATSCTADAQNQIARLMEQLGSSQNLSANYGLNATGAPMHRIPRTLENFGYSNGGSYLPYDTTAVVNELSTGHPVLVEGWTENVEGHCWLLHGLLRRTRTVKVHNLETKEIMKKVYESLVEKGYNPINQIVGYILSGDPTYITSHNDARNLIRKVERDELLEKMVKNYIGLEK